MKLDARTNAAKEPGGTLPNRKTKQEDFIINGISGMRLTNANLVAYGAVRRAERAPQGRGYSILLRWVAEISCAGRSAVTSSQRNEHVRAFSKSRAGVYCDLRLHCVSLGACVECVPAIAPTLSHRRESRRAQLRSDNDCVGQLRSCCSPAAGQRTSPSRSIFQNSGVDSAVGRIAVSGRAHFRARAARARLKL